MTKFQQLIQTLNERKAEEEQRVQKLQQDIEAQSMLYVVTTVAVTVVVGCCCALVCYLDCSKKISIVFSVCENKEET